MKARPLYKSGKRRVFIIQSTEGQIELDLFFLTRELAEEHIMNNDYDESWYIGEYTLSAKLSRPKIEPI